jgi:hypothetical protein
MVLSLPFPSLAQNRRLSSFLQPALNNIHQQAFHKIGYLFESSPTYIHQPRTGSLRGSDSHLGNLTAATEGNEATGS